MTDGRSPYWQIEVPDCDCIETGKKWQGKPHARRCPHILAVALKWGAYEVYYRRTGRESLPKPPSQELAVA